MKQTSFIVVIFCLIILKGFGQDTLQNHQSLGNPDDEVYKLKPGLDIPIILATGGWSYYALSKIYKKDSSTSAEIMALDKKNINGFDRWAASVYHPRAETTSDRFFFIAMPLPLLLLADREIRKDALKVGILYLEALSITGVLYTSSTYLNRYRPYAYNSAMSINERKSGNSKNSFFAGHVALVATSTFFTAKVFSDYHPRSKFKWVFYGLAAGATGATAYLRHRAGKHFPSDILLGTAVGTLSGILVPQVHKKKRIGKSGVRILPYFGEGNGITILYKL